MINYNMVVSELAQTYGTVIILKLFIFSTFSKCFFNFNEPAVPNALMEHWNFSYSDDFRKYSLHRI